MRPLSPVKGGLGALLHSPDIGLVAIFLGVVGAVADDECVADREADKINRDPDLGRDHRGETDDLRLLCCEPVWFEVIGKRIET